MAFNFGSIKIGVTVLALAAGLMASPALAKRNTSAYFEYFSDATYTVVVGTFTRTCEGYIVRTGVMTEFIQGSSEPCD